MSEKIDQHLLPKVFLRAFTDSTRPKHHPPDAPFSPPIWLIPRGLDSAGRARDPKNAFTSKRFYNLRDDDPRDPAIEAGLGRLESAYAEIIRLLAQRVELNAEQYGTLLLFIGTLRSRQPTHLDHWQTQFGEVERIYRSVERAHTGKEEAADRVFWMKDEMSRRLMFQQAEAHAEVVGPGGWLLVNETRVPFLTSDQPVLHYFLHPDELVTLAFPATLIRPGATRADRAFFSFCALSPQIAFVSSPLLARSSPGLYRGTGDPHLVLMLNDLQRQLCSEFLISPSADPFGPLAPLVREIDTLARRLGEVAARAAVSLYTATDRFHIPCSVVVFEDGPSPLQTRIRFRSPDAARYSALAVGTVLREVTAVDGQGSEGGMRGARIVQAAGTPDDDWLIEADPSVAA